MSEFDPISYSKASGNTEQLATITNQVEYDKQAFVDQLSIEIGKYLAATSTYKSNILAVGDSAVEGGGSTDPADKSYIGLLNKAVTMAQYGGYKDTLYIEYAATNGFVISGYTGTWAEEQNAYCTTGYGVLDSTAMAHRGWYKTTENAATMTIATYGLATKILFASDGAIAGKTAGAISYSVNGGDPVAVELSGSTLYKWVEIAAPGSSVNIVVTTDITAGEVVAIQCVMLASNLTGAHVINFGTGGSQVRHWVERLSILDAFAPKMTLVGVGGNDMVNGVTTAQFIVSYRALLTKLATLGPIVMLIYFPWLTADAGTLALITEYRAATKALAEEFGATVIDFHDIVIDGATMNAKGLMSDTIHPNDAGYYVLYQWLRKKLYLP